MPNMSAPITNAKLITTHVSQFRRMQVGDQESSHRGWLLKLSSIFSSPKRRDSLPLGIESETVFSVEVEQSRSSNTSLVTSKGEHGKGNGDRDINSNLSGLNTLLKVCCARSGLGKDHCAVAPFVTIDKVDRAVDCIGLNAKQHRAENLLSVAPHFGFHPGDNSRTDLLD